MPTVPFMLFFFASLTTKVLHVYGQFILQANDRKVITLMSLKQVTTLHYMSLKQVTCYITCPTSRSHATLHVPQAGHMLHYMSHKQVTTLHYMSYKQVTTSHHITLHVPQAGHLDISGRTMNSPWGI